MNNVDVQQKVQFVEVTRQSGANIKHNITYPSRSTHTNNKIAW